MPFFKNAIRKTLKKSGFRNIVILSSGVLIAQTITIISQPIIARLYTPEEFGILANLTSIVSMISPLITLQYHKSIITVKSEQQVNTISALTFYIVIILSLLTALILSICEIINPTLFRNIGKWIYLVIPLLILTGLGQLFDSYNIRFGQFKLMSSIALVRSVISNGLKIVLGILKLGAFGLIFAHIISNIMGIRRQGKYFFSKIRQVFSISFKEMKMAAVEHKIQPLFSMPGIFVTTFSYSVLPVMITSLYTIADAGYFSMSMLVLGMPLALISNNVSKVFFKNASEERNIVGNFYSTFKSTLMLLISVALIGFPVLWLIAEELFLFFLGKEWIKSGVFVKILVPMYAARFIVTSLMNGFILSGRQLLKLILQSLFIFESLAIFWIAKNFGISIEYFLSLINYSYMGNYIILIVVLYFTSKKNEN